MLLFLLSIVFLVVLVSASAMADRKKQIEKFKFIKQTIIVSSNQDIQKKFGSSVIRGAVGGSLLGPAGLVGGAVSGKNKITNQTTFLIEYEDGKRETLTVNNNSYEFQELCKYIKM